MGFSPSTQGHRRRKGSILLITALLLVALVGVMAIALELGALMTERRHAQSVADAAALAAASDLSYNFGINNGTDPQGTAKASALATATAAGYRNDGTTTTVTINIPPLAGDYATLPGYAEVVVVFNQPRAFSAIFGSSPLTTSARSVARGLWQTTSIGLLALESSLPAALTIAAGTRVAVPNEAVVVDSVSPLATVIALTGSITAQTLKLSGGGLALLSGPINATIQTEATPTPDPFSYLASPNPSSLPTQRSSLVSLTGTQALTLQPGVYYGGIRVAGSANLILNPGTYYMAGGGFTVAGAASVTGQGVTIINAPILPTDAISIAGTGNFNVTPPSSGIYEGFSIIQSPELLNLLGVNPPLVITANSLLGGTFSLGGTVYAPASSLTITATGSAQVGAQVVVRSVALAGNGSLKLAWDTNTGRTPLPVKLVE